jgi:hypothetical protein
MHGSRVIARVSRNHYAILEIQQIKADLIRKIVKRMILQAFDVCVITFNLD